MSDRLKPALLDEWGKIWGVPGLSGKSTITVEGRLKTSLGRCCPGKGLIKMNPVLLKPGNEALLEEILCHEAAHLAVRLIFGGKAKPHGPEWKNLLRKAGYAPRVKIEATAVKGFDRGPVRRGYLYVHACRDCRAVYKSLRTDRRWRCLKCVTTGKSGRLVVVEKVRR